MRKEIVDRPYCAYCGIVRPNKFTLSYCLPCLNTGHIYRLVTNEQDRLARITRWLCFYSKQGFTYREIKSIGWFNKYLIGRKFAPQWNKKNKVDKPKTKKTR